MNLPGYYTSGQFARMANISVRTVRFYDKQNILKPSYVSPSGSRFYTDQDFARLQQILLLKYLGFSLDDIKEMTIDDTDFHFMLNSLKMQQKLIRDRIEQIQMVEKSIEDTTQEISTQQSINWSRMMNLIHLTNMEKSLKSQYQNSSNISARIRLHSLYSKNKQGWFPWLFEQCNIKDNIKILEIGCGSGALWAENKDNLPMTVSITLSDISEGMLRDAKREIGSLDNRFSFHSFDCHEIPYPDSSFDLVIANHVLFYCDIPKVCREVQRILKPGGTFLCSAYGSAHMEEISNLVQEFDSRIILSGEKLYEKFGKENGKTLLSPYFSNISWKLYEDYLEVDTPEPLIDYILSCHGNQNQYLLDRYKEFCSFVAKKTKTSFHITKEAGVFLCKRP